MPRTYVDRGCTFLSLAVTFVAANDSKTSPWLVKNSLKWAPESTSFYQNLACLNVLNLQKPPPPLALVPRVHLWSGPGVTFHFPRAVKYDFDKLYATVYEMISSFKTSENANSIPAFGYRYKVYRSKVMGHLCWTTMFYFQFIHVLHLDWMRAETNVGENLINKSCPFLWCLSIRKRTAKYLIYLEFFDIEMRMMNAEKTSHTYLMICIEANIKVLQQKQAASPLYFGGIIWVNC